MKNKISKIKYEYVLLLIALIWVLFFSFAIQLNPGFSLVGDDGSYLTAAKRLYLEMKIDEGRPLLIAAINGFPLLFGFSDSIVIKWGLLVNFCCWFSTILLLFKIISGNVSRQKAFLLSLLFIFCIGNLAIAFNLLSESVFIFMLVLAVYFLHRYFKSNKHHFITIAIAVLLLAMLVRPMSIGVVFILIGFFYSKSKAILWNKYASLIYISLALLFFQMLSLKRNYGDFTISYIDSITYYNYLGGKADCLKKNIPFIPGENKRGKYFNQFSSHEQKRIAREDLKEQLQHNTINLSKAYLYCLYSNSSKGSYIVSECKNDKQTNYFNAFHFLFKAISKVQNILFTVGGVLVSFYTLFRRKRETVFNRIVALMLLYVFFISGVSCFQCDRFHIVFYPLVIILFSKFFKSEKRLEI